MSQTHPVQLGTISGTPVTADLLNKGAGSHPWDQVNVRLTSNYVTANPPGYPNRPPSGQPANKLGALGTVSSGTTRAFFAHEAAAIVAAGGGSYA